MPVFRILVFYLTIFFIVLLSSWTYAVPVAPVVHTLSQHDGFEFEARQWGDERLRGWETVGGHSIVFDDDLRSWTYAVHAADGSLISSSRVVGRDHPPSDVSKNIRPIGQARLVSALKLFSREMSAEAPQRIVPSTGTANIPVILINFSDTTTAFTAEDFNTLLFGTGNYSTKDYYEEVSYGAFSVSAGPSGAVGWYLASNTHNYYGTNVGSDDAWPGDLVYEAVAAADAAGFNFAAYDQNNDCYVDVVAIIHQGSGEEASGNATDIWSHRWTLNGAKYYGRSHNGEYTTNATCIADPSQKVKVNDYIIQPETYLGGMQTMGVFAHEYGHALGLPDLYDTDYSSEGIGQWSLMAGGSWNRVSISGDRPAHPDAWCKYKLGWVTPIQVTGTLTNEPISQSATTADVYKLLSGSPSIGGEYFLVENRQKAGFDIGLPGAGLLIWHIDESKSTNTEECYPGGPSCVTNHYHVALVQADNLWHMERGLNGGDTGDPYPGSAGNTSFTASSSPNSNLYNESPSGVSITGISTSGSTMTATLSIAELPSCPSLYFWNGSDFERRGFIFPGAMPRENEYRDHIPLNQLKLKDGMYVLQIRETELERSFIDMVKLVVVDHSYDSLTNPVRTFKEPLTPRPTHTPEVLYKSKSYAASGSNIGELSPISAIHSKLGNVLPQLIYSDDSYVEMYPGDIITIQFPYIPLNDEKRDFIFVGEGFYVPLKEQ